mmetsp:Transcript_22288/g.50199  ORF Transcript_22288/g.50199 Transcript_22288/m.50199 type:complete len:583 (+) Transcript_22288:34-1782(+)
MGRRCPSWSSALAAFLWLPHVASQGQVVMRVPPVRAPRGNPVNITMYFSDLKAFDETEGRVTVYALMTITWSDNRWYEATIRNVQDTCAASGCTSEEAAEAQAFATGNLYYGIFGQTAGAFFEATRATGQVLGLAMSQGDVWTPIPKDLFLKTSTNPLGKTEYDPIIYMPAGFSPDTMEALWVDRAVTHFDVTLSYEHYPFDEQVLDLCVNFDYFTTPRYKNWSPDLPIENVSERWDTASEVSPLVSARFLTALERKGFSVQSIRIVEKNDAMIGSKVCMEIVVVRRISILLLRFFLPLSFLLFIPFAGFFIPIDMVMPRVATGFISFLSLQVFRTLAYSMIPKETSSLLWMDVTMFCVTVIMFASVLENVLAQAMRATVSTHSARFVDDMSRVTFPLVGVVVLAVLFIMGAANVGTTLIMIVTLIITFGWLVGFGVAVFLYVRWLPTLLMRILIRQISSSDFRYQKAIQLDQKELAMVFRTFDEDGTGDVSAEEVIESFEAHGLRFKKQEDELHFKGRLTEMFHCKGNNRLDLDGFCHHFAELFRYHAPDVNEPNAPPEVEKAVSTAMSQDSGPSEIAFWA